MEQTYLASGGSVLLTPDHATHAPDLFPSIPSSRGNSGLGNISIVHLKGMPELAAVNMDHRRWPYVLIDMLEAIIRGTINGLHLWPHEYILRPADLFSV
jgi:hypothetical protein